MEPQDCIQILYGKDVYKADALLKEMQRDSIESNRYYCYFDEFAKMMEHPNSYVRNRGLILLAANVRWDKERKLDQYLDEYLFHVTDVKPITSRMCVKQLSLIVQARPDLADKIADRLHNADLSYYKDSMRPLIEKDMQQVLEEIAM